MSRLTFLTVSKMPAFPFIRQSFINEKYISSPIWSTLTKFLTTFSGNPFPVAISPCISSNDIFWKNQMRMKILCMYLVPGNY